MCIHTACFHCVLSIYPSPIISLSVDAYICTHVWHENRQWQLRGSKRTSEGDKGGRDGARGTIINTVLWYIQKHVLLIPQSSPSFRLAKNLSNPKLIYIWWDTPAIAAFERMRQNPYCEFKICLYYGYIVETLMEQFQPSYLLFGTFLKDGVH